DTARTCPRVIDIANGALQFSITMRGSDPQRWPVGLDEGRYKRFLRGYETVPGSVISIAELEALPWLMIEALIVEAVVPIAATGRCRGARARAAAGPPAAPAPVAQPAPVDAAKLRALVADLGAPEIQKRLEASQQLTDGPYGLRDIEAVLRTEQLSAEQRVRL